MKQGKQTAYTIGNSITNLGASLTVGVTAPIVGIGTARLKATMDFDKSMSKVQALSGATGEQIILLKDKATELGATTATNANTTIGMMGEAFTYAGWVAGALGYSVEVGKLAQTGIPQKMLCNGLGMYEIISNAYVGASKQNKKQYSIEMRQGKLCVDEIGKEVVATPISSDTNILESSYSENAEEVIDRVKIYDEQDKPAGAVASNMLRDIEQNVEITTLGNTSYVSGKLVNVEDSATKQLGLFCIVSDSHSWSGGQYKTNINLEVV